MIQTYCKFCKINKNQLDFTYTSMEDDNFKKCWSLSNLRPLKSDLNLKKGSKMEGNIVL